MESPTRISNIEPHPHHLTCTTNGRSRNTIDSICASPEFEFQNPCFPQSNLHSADELFVDGILRPLHHLQHNQPQPNPTVSPASITAQPSSSATLTSSKRWTDIFKKSSTSGKNQEEKKGRDNKERKKEKKGVALNTGESLSIINIWPFSRSRSAGNNVSRGRMLSGTRKVSSAPCSRSNSGGDSKTRKWPSSPSRTAGVHLGRSSPVWQFRRNSDHNISRRPFVPTASAAAADGNKARVLNFNVSNMCIGYGHHVSCRSDENSASVGGVRATRYGGRPQTTTTANVEGGSNIFSLRSLFSVKKVH